MCESDNFSYAIYKDERVMVDFFYNGDDILSVGLYSLGVYDLELKVGYETIEWSEYLNKSEDDALSNF